MSHAVRTLGRLVLYLAVMLILTVLTLYIFHQFIATSISLPTLIDEGVRIVIILFFAAAATIIIRRFKPFMTHYIGNQAATMLQYIMFAATFAVVSLGVLNTLQVGSVSELLTGLGIISITAGLVISTFVGSLLSGFLVFTNYHFKVGDDIMFNNIPGKILEMSALVMRIQTDVGQVTIPNSAVASGGVIITVVHKFPGLKEGRLHYDVGDRVFTNYMNEQGYIKEITPLNTTVQLDSGKQVTFLNNSVLSGAMVIARIKPEQTEKSEPMHSIN